MASDLDTQEKILQAQLKRAEIEELDKQEKELRAQLSQVEPESAPAVDTEEARIAYAKKLETQGAPELPVQDLDLGGKSFGQKALDILGRSGAATRAGIAGTVEAGPIAGAKAFGRAIGQPSEISPTGEELATMLGVEKIPAMLGLPEPKATGLAVPSVPGGIGLDIDVAPPAEKEYRATEVAGVPLEAAADIANYIPLKPVVSGVGAVAKIPIKAATGATAGIGYLLGRGAARAAKDVAEIGGAAVSPAFAEASKGAVQSAIDAARVQGPEVVRTVVSAYRDALSPALQPGFEKAVELAARNGIDPSLIPFSMKYGPNAFVDKLRKWKANLGITKEVVEHNKGLEQVQNAVSNNISKIGGDIAIPTAEQAGKALQDGYNEAVKNIFDANKLRYSTVIDTLGSDYITPEIKAKVVASLESKIQAINSQLKTALSESRSTLQATKSDLEGIRNYLIGGDVKPRGEPGFLDRIKESGARLLDVSPGQKAIVDPDPAGLSGFITQMQEVGKIAHSQPKYSLGSAYADRRILKDVYSEMRIALMEIVEAQGGKEARASLQAANDAQSSFLKQNALIEKVFNDPMIAPENIFKSVFEKGDSKELAALAQIIGVDNPQMKIAKAAYLNRALPRNAAGNILFPTTKKFLAQKDSSFPRISEALFKPGELDDFNGLLDLGDAFGNPILNPSGTATTSQVREVITSPITALGSLTIGEAMIKNAEKQAALRFANQQKGKLTPDVANEIARMITGKGNSPTAAEDIVRALQDSTEKTGVGLSMAPTQTEVVTKAISIAARVWEIDPFFGPIYIPEQFRTEVINQVMKDNSLSNLDKAKNRFNLETNGYLIKVGTKTKLTPRGQMLQGVSKDAIRADKRE